MSGFKPCLAVAAAQNVLNVDRILFWLQKAAKEILRSVKWFLLVICFDVGNSVVVLRTSSTASRGEGFHVLNASSRL